MKKEFLITRIEDCSNWLQEITLEQWQTVPLLSELLSKLSVSLAFVNEQQAIAKRLLNNKKVDAYMSLITSSTAQEKYFAPSLAKDFIAAKCATEQYYYDMAERCSRSIVHTADMGRSVLSALKGEREYSNLQP